MQITSIALPFLYCVCSKATFINNFTRFLNREKRLAVYIPRNLDRHTPNLSTWAIRLVTFSRQQTIQIISFTFERAHRK